MNIQEKIRTLPLSSGVYLMKNQDGTVIYVGKAVSLKRRVASYFRKTKHYNKTDLLVADITDVEVIETNSEAEALILEASLIKEYEPKFNIELRDDKSYPYIEITSEDFPKVCVVRPHQRNKKSNYYGPYVNPGLIREALKIIRKIFYFRTEESNKERDRLDFQIGLAPAASVAEYNRKAYRNNIRNVRLILEGKKDELYRQLRKNMETLAQKKQFKEAAKVRDQLRAVGALYSGTKDVNYFKEAEQLQRALGLTRLPQRIETFDISNIMGNQAVGSMVSFLDGKPDKINYRRFKIKTVEGIDDYKMIAEIVKRRYRRLKEEGRLFPDLIVIDGGKGQLSFAVQELKKLGLDIPIASLAKKEEEVFLPQKRSALRMSLDSLGLKLLQRMRDEAHRFALSYHKTLRKKEVFERKDAL